MQAEQETTIDESLLHPLFDSPDGDVILGAKGGTFFRVHSFTLKMTSGWFRAMYSLPQQEATSNANVDVIYVDEDASTLESILRMICGLPVLPIDSYDKVEALLYAAEKYDMPGPTSIIRLLIMTPALFDQQPLRLYSIACRFGWEAEAKLASTQTLTFDLHAPEHRPLLQTLGTDAILNLFELHRSRREGLRQRLDDPPFVGGGTVPCHLCRESIDHHTWRELKYKMILEMDTRPLGDTIIGTGLLEWQEAKACWEAKCATVNCRRILYDKAETLRVIRECIDGLPRSI
jgi:hypothetical protein